ncbi:MAG: DNA polymerase IV [Desulfobacterales bacterium]|nr:DNA polymerase IV [Desulfobacterales bacterium]
MGALKWPRASDTLPTMILHLDMDAFFASVEQLDNPELRGKPVVISGQSARSVVATASYEARKYGIHSAMPLFQALKLCPDVLVVRGRRHRYKEISCAVFSILEEYTPLVEPVSIDEAYLDVTGCERLFGPPLKIAKTIKEKVFQETGLTCSVGCAPIKFLAKVASDIHKPNGLTHISIEEMDDFLVGLPVKKVPGAGKRTTQALSSMGIHTLGDLRRFPKELLIKKLGLSGQRLVALAWGKDPSTVSPHAERAKSVSTETTLEKDTTDPQFVKAVLLAQSDEVARELRRKGFYARRVTLKLTFSDFTRITRQTTLPHTTDVAGRIFEETALLFDRNYKGQRIRLIGVGCAEIETQKSEVPCQLDLFGAVKKRETHDEEWEKVEKSMDDILKKFGKEAIFRARLKKKE